MREWYERETMIRFSDCDASGRWKPSSILVDMQELGELHAATYGLSRQNLLEHDMCWVLYRQKVRMRAYPQALETVRALTWPGGVEGPVFPRYFVFQRPDGTPLGEAVTAWVLMNVRTRRPVRPSALPGELPLAKDLEAPLPLPPMLRVEGAAPISERAVCYSDVDVNGHMGNTRYIDWICDLLDYGTLMEKRLSAWQINYITEARPLETLSLFRAPGEDRMLFTGKRLSDGRTVFDAEVAF